MPKKVAKGSEKRTAWNLPINVVIAVLRAHGLPDAVRPAAIAVLAAEDGRNRAEAVRTLVRRAAKFNGGRPAKTGAQAKARAAYRASRKRGETKKAATICAQEAGGFSRGYVLELKKKRKWDGDL